LAKKLVTIAQDENKQSNIQRVGYFVMLAVRLVAEFWFLYLEMELNRNQSQNAGFFEAMNLKEKWYCFSYTDSDSSRPQDTYRKVVDAKMPMANRSSLFWVDEPLIACSQQDTVKCWIPFSRIKSYGIQFMYMLLCVNICLTVLEILWLVYETCKSASKKTKTV